MSEFPVFRYHPDPVGTGSFETTEDPCEFCDLARGWRYTANVYAVEEFETVCPWCIADGSVATHEASLTDGYGAPPEVAREIVDTITLRTPGFSGWQQERWLYHCNDAAAFLGVVGWAEVAQLPDAVQSLRADISGPSWSEQQVDGYLRSLSSDGEPTAYLFRCLHCGEHLAYSDFT